MGGRGSSSGVRSGGASGGSNSKSTQDLKDELYRLQDENKILFRQRMKARRSGNVDEEESARKTWRKNSDRIDNLKAEISRREPRDTHVQTKAEYDKAREQFAATSTTTYERARNRRIKNFDSWFFGSEKK